MIDGQCSPKSNAFKDAIQALYGITFTVKFTLKFTKVGPEYTVAPLDGLWWTPGNKKWDTQHPDQWHWTLIIIQPNHIMKKHVTDAVKLIRERAVKKKKKPNPVLDKVKLKSFKEGLCVQIMHIGPYSAEEPTTKKLHYFAEEKGYKLRGKHHKIYISDPRRIKSSKLKTVIRHPVKNK